MCCVLKSQMSGKILFYFCFGARKSCYTDRRISQWNNKKHISNLIKCELFVLNVKTWIVSSLFKSSLTLDCVIWSCRLLFYLYFSFLGTFLKRSFSFHLQFIPTYSYVCWLLNFIFEWGIEMKDWLSMCVYECDGFSVPLQIHQAYLSSLQEFI